MRRFSVLALLAMLLALAAPGAQARDVKDLRVSPSNPTAEGDYQGGPVFLTSVNVRSQSPTVCRNADYCDVIDLDINVPEDYAEDFNFKITLSWAAGTSGADGDPTDLDMALFNDGEKAVGTAATAANPEVISVAYGIPGRYYITVLQFNDVLVIYNVLVEFIVRQPILPKKRTTSPVGSTTPGGGSYFSDPFSGSDYSTLGLGVVPITDPSALEPIAIDIPTDDTEPIGFGPLDEDVEVGSSIRFDGERLSLGLLFVGVIGLLSYFLFFVPRRVPVRKQGPTA